MTDLRRNDLTDISRPNSQQQQQQQQQQEKQKQQQRELFLGSFVSGGCSEMPESMPKSLSASNAPGGQLTNGHNLMQNHNSLPPQTLSDHGSVMGSSISGGSTTSSTATTATAATIGRLNWNGNNGNPNPSDMSHTLKGDSQFGEREIYYVSSATAASPTPTPTPTLATIAATSNATLRGNVCSGGGNTTSSARNLRQNVIPYSVQTPSTPYGNMRNMPAQPDMSFDSYEISSHYSDTAMQALRSGSSSSSLTAPNQPATHQQLQHQQQQQQQHQQHQQQRAQNSVTFSNYVSSQYPSGCGGNNNRGSLRRAKGRSNQSLCSCDAGDETEINPDPTRPLYQYSLERSGSSGQKMHTYTCEQNAQILMRLERERHRRLSLGGGVGSGSIKDGSQFDMTESGDVDDIPPVPPPPSMKRNGSIRSLRLFQQHLHEQPLSRCSSNNFNNINNNNNTTNGSVHENNTNNGISSSSNCHSNNNSRPLAALCSGDLLSDCTNGTGLDIGSVIDDCTTSILKCANAVGSEIMASTTGNQKSSIATIASNAKPDICRVGNHATTSFNNNFSPPCFVHDDDFFASKSKKSDPSLCFLHAGPDGIGPGTDLSKSYGDLQGKRQSKYNTIGPSSDYMRRQLLHCNQKQQQMQHHSHQERQRITERCRCFSQSLSNFSRDYFGQNIQHKQQQQQQQLQTTARNGDNQSHRQHIYHTSADAENRYNWMNGGTHVALPPPPPAISRSYSNLVDIDERQISAQQQHLPYQKFHSPADVFSSSCSFGGSGNANLFNEASFMPLNKAANNGLKEKLHHHEHQQQQQQQLHHHIHRHDHHLQSLTLPVLQHHKSQHNHHQHNLHPLLHHQQRQQQHLSSSTLSLQQQKQQLHSSSMSSIMPWKHRQCPSRGSSSSGTNSFRFDAAKHWLAVSSILLIIGAASVAVPLALRVAASAPFEERLRVAVQLLDSVPLIDGHNDLPWNIRKFLHNKLNDFNFDEDLRSVMPWARSHWSHTDLQRLKKGRVSAQFWAAYVPCEAQHRDAVQLTLEQIDVIKRLTDRYSPQLTTCTSADDIIEAHKNHQLCSLTGVEGGHSLGGSLAVLRTLYAIGVRYMTLTSTCHTPWADSSYADAPTYNVKHGGLTIFGKTIIREMNRLGMMVDLSHVSTGTMRDALEVSEAPVIFSHSSAYELCNSSRNVQDDMLQSLAKNGGLVMVNFYSKFLSCSENATVHDAVAHINHIKQIAGIDHVGLGAGYDGINFTPKGLEDVSSYPTLFAELLGGGWTIDDLTKLAGGNFLRVMKQVEKIRDDKKAAGLKPYEDHPNFRTEDPYNCTSS